MKKSADRPQVQYFTINEDDDGQRLDNYLFKTLKGVPKSHLYKLLRKGEIRVNKKRAKPTLRIRIDDVVRVAPLNLPETSEPKVNVNLDSIRALEEAIVFENAGLLVVNKPSGMAVHGGSGLNYGLIEAMRALRPQAKFLELVHRLDRDTSGCLMIAKKSSTLKALHRMLQDKSITKRYVCIVHGGWPKAAKWVDAPLRKTQSASGERHIRISPDGKPSLTGFKILENFSNYTYLEAEPVTGRTHQIRVHALSEGCPIAGDNRYCEKSLLQQSSGSGLNRLFLHAKWLQFTDPDTGEAINAHAPLPAELSTLLTQLRGADSA